MCRVGKSREERRIYTPPPTRPREQASARGEFAIRVDALLVPAPCPKGVVDDHWSRWVTRPGFRWERHLEVEQGRVGRIRRPVPAELRGERSVRRELIHGLCIVAVLEPPNRGTRLWGDSEVRVEGHTISDHCGRNREDDRVVSALRLPECKHDAPIRRLTHCREVHPKLNLTDPEAISETLRNRVVVVDDRESLGVCRPEPVDMRTPRELHEQEQIETALQVDWLSVFAAVMGMGVTRIDGDL